MGPPEAESFTEHSRKDAEVKSAPRSDSAASRRPALWLLLTLTFFYLLTSSGRVRTIDEVLPLFQAESFIHHGNFAVPQAVAGNLFIGKYDRFGRPEAPYPPGFALAITPAYLAGQFLAAHLPGVPVRSRDLVGDAVVTGSDAFFAALAATFAFVLFRRFGIALRPALCATLLIALGTPVFAYSAWLFSEPLTTALLLGAALALFGAPEDERLYFLRVAIGGALLGAAVWVRPTHAIVVPVFLLAILVRNGRSGIRAIVIAGCVAGAFVVAYLTRNAILFGNPFDFGYPSSIEAGKRMNSFDTPLTTGLIGFLLSPGKSVFLFAPLVVLAIAGLRRLWRLDRGLATVATLAPLTYLLFYARFSQWEGSYCYGPRYLVPGIALLCLALGPLIADASKRAHLLAILLGVAGFGVQCIGLGTSFLEDQAGGRYYDASLNYRLGYAPLVSQTKLLLHYLAHPAAPLGRGLDRWFIFLAKANVSRATIGVILGFEALAMTIALVKLWRSGFAIERTVTED